MLAVSHFYGHSLFPWQIRPITYSPPISPPIHTTDTNNDSTVTTTTASIETSDYRNGLNYLNNNMYIGYYGNIAGTLGDRKTRNSGRNFLYEPYLNWNSSTMGSIRPDPSRPPTSPDSSGSSSPRNKSFTCKLCKRSFGYKHVLENHMRTHTGKFMFCRVCLIVVISYLFLKFIYICCVSGEKPYGCKECGKRFTRDHHLKTHIRLHTGERPFCCKRCDRTFVQVANLRRHERKCKNENGNETRQRNFKDVLGLKSRIDEINHVSPMNYESSKILEQSEPEDLSMHSLRYESPPTSSIEDLDDLEDSEALNLKQRPSIAQ